MVFLNGLSSGYVFECARCALPLPPKCAAHFRQNGVRCTYDVHIQTANSQTDEFVDRHVDNSIRHLYEFMTFSFIKCTQ